MNRIIYFSMCLSALLYSCNGLSEEESKSEEATKTESKKITPRQKINKNLVDTLHLHRTTFQKQINCNGKLRAIDKSDLNMPVSGILEKITVGNGSYVKKGQLLAMTDTIDSKLDLIKAKRQVDKSYIDLIDKLIGLGYSADTSSVPQLMLQRTKISSGYSAAQDQLQIAQRRLDKCYLYAPFSGRVANMDSRLHQNTSDFCTLIDDSYFYVEYAILEAELSLCKLGQKVIIYPFIDEQMQFEGSITEINPLVDDKGQVVVRAKVKNRNGYLVEGMNIRVIMENSEPNLFVVPKDAIVIRDGYYVAFIYDKTTKSAIWTYVEVLYSNMTSHAITGHKLKRTTINEGDIIITSGNLNLADGTEVTPKAKKRPRK